VTSAVVTFDVASSFLCRSSSSVLPSVALVMIATITRMSETNPITAAISRA